MLVFSFRNKGNYAQLIIQKKNIHIFICYVILTFRLMDGKKLQVLVRRQAERAAPDQSLAFLSHYDHLPKTFVSLSAEFKNDL